MTFRFLLAAALCAASFAAPAATRYVRADGGTSSQCTGAVDAAYPGSGTAQACAYSTPATGIANIAGGDTLVIKNGSYAVASQLTAPAGGTASAPTRIRGEQAGDCRVKPELYASGGTRTQMLNLSASTGVEVECLEITDHSACVYRHPDFPCSGSYAIHGIYAYGASNVTLRDVYVHGIGNGFKGGKVNNLTLERVRFIANSEAGFHGATGCSTSGCDSFTGTIIFRNVEIAWNGCGEAYPKLTIIGCHGQADRDGNGSNDGYGDGVGTTDTAGVWIVEDSQIHHNTSDGLDLRYSKLAGADVQIRRSWFYGNAGNQVKVWGKLLMENSVAVSNCKYFGTRYGAGSNGATDPEPCRADGNTVFVVAPAMTGTGITLRYNTIAGESLALFQTNSEAGATSASVARLENNVFVGATVYTGSGLPKYVSNGANITVQSYGNTVYNTSGTCPSGQSCANPLLRGLGITAFDARPAAGSPVIGAGTTSCGTTACVTPATDITGKPRPAAPARGAFEP